MDREIRTLSLFSGAGGLDVGFDKAGFRICACVEINARYAATLSANCGADRFFGEGTEVFCQDVNEFDAEDFIESGIECVVGGPPCQTFSAAGRRAGGVIGTSDERGRLFERFCEILAIVRPKVFVFENVYGLPGANAGKPWKRILNAFANLGYWLNFEIVDAADYGVPQHRERLFLVGCRGKMFRFPMPTHGPDSRSGQPLVSVAEAISDLQNPEERPSKGPGGLYGHLLPQVPAGLNYSFFTAEMGHPKPVFAWRSKFHDLLYKVDPDYPCRTLKAQPGKFTGPFHWHNRHFTIPELKRLQSFPDEYHLEGSGPVILEQIGNSVPPKLAHAIALAVRQQFFDGLNVDFEERPIGFKSTFRSRQRERSKTFRLIAAAAIERQTATGEIEAEPRVFDENYSISLQDFFGIEKLASPSGDSSSAEVNVKDGGDRLTVNFNASGSSDRGIGRICLSGLSKYLQRIDSIEVDCRLKSIRDVFFLWWVIQDAMIQRSRFFSIIDVYGHYANRGDTVRVSGSYGLAQGDPAARALDFFLKSANCGGFLARSVLAASLEVSSMQLSHLVERLREIRMDVRTSASHPILGQDRILCTYPFPLLSHRALVVSRVEFLDSTTG